MERMERIERLERIERIEQNNPEPADEIGERLHLVLEARGARFQGISTPALSQGRVKKVEFAKANEKKGSGWGRRALATVAAGGTLLLAPFAARHLTGDWWMSHEISWKSPMADAPVDVMLEPDAVELGGRGAQWGYTHVVPDQANLPHVDEFQTGKDMGVLINSKDGSGADQPHGVRASLRNYSFPAAYEEVQKGAEQDLQERRQGVGRNVVAQNTTRNPEGAALVKGVAPPSTSKGDEEVSMMDFSSKSQGAVLRGLATLQVKAEAEPLQAFDAKEVSGVPDADKPPMVPPTTPQLPRWFSLGVGACLLFGGIGCAALVLPAVRRRQREPLFLDLEPTKATEKPDRRGSPKARAARKPPNEVRGMPAGKPQRA